jgi:acetyl esterase
MRCSSILALLVVLVPGSNVPAQNRQTSRAEQVQPTVADVRYGEQPRNIFDVYQVNSNQPTPVLIYFHGGGFVAGDKMNARRLPLARTCLQNGITVISANYRFVKGPDSEPFPGSLHDGVRAVQFVRAHAKRWNIDPTKIVVSGSSAGGLMAVWLGVHDDLADPKSGDPVRTQSSRVLAVIGYGAQTTVDPQVILSSIGGNPDIHPSVFPIYDVEKIAELSTPALRPKVTEFSSLNHVSKDDPPMWLGYGGTLAGTPLPEDANIGVSIHHAMFGELMRKKYEQVSAPATIQVICADCPHRGATEVDFLRRVLKLPMASE